MKSYELLERGLALIEDPLNWVKGVSKIDVPYADGMRTAYCSYGALAHIAEKEVENAAPLSAALVALGEQVEQEGMAGQAIVAFNDKHTHAEVIAVWKAAIRSEKAKHGIEVEVPEEEAVPAVF